MSKVETPNLVLEHLRYIRRKGDRFIFSRDFHPPEFHQEISASDSFLSFPPFQACLAQ
ncbi:hypothetical protein RM530_05785 [Algiphilus sp. W345]|uniref:Uncharacterized protein n=1 Tax=Banduia mediterranea TaxID=3075609 RepID=A0ABU2WGW4_9GAMM|nr:hypothetical protein [Algiphilus sp. W345]MDT0496874.1 hypothetical protein [Algiphilus sp. W345]